MATYDSMWVAPQRPQNWQMSNYGLNVGQMGGAATGKSAWATGDTGVDQYIGALDAALKGGRVGGAKQMAQDIEQAKRLSSLGQTNTNIDLNALPTFGAAGGGAGGYQATLRENPFEGRLMNLLNDPSSLANDPGYKFEMQQGQQALARSAAARNMTGSGNTLAALLEQSQGFAAKRRGQELDRLGGFMQGRDQTNASLYGSDASAGASRYGTDVGSKTSMWNTAQKINADNYWNAQQRLTGGGGGGGGASWAPTLGNTAYRGGAVEPRGSVGPSQSDLESQYYGDRQSYNTANFGGRDGAFPSLSSWMSGNRPQMPAKRSGQA